MIFENLLVTGGCGFIGTNFIRYLLEETDFQGRIINVDILTYAANLKNLEDIQKKYSNRYVFREENICNAEMMKNIFIGQKIDSVCHFAAESHVDRSITGPKDFIFTNIIGTFNLLEAARNTKDFKLFHHISTDEVYGSLGPVGSFTETTPYQPNSPYSASKASSDHLVRAYFKTYGLPITISNCSNNYGPYQFPEKLIPLIILNARDKKPLPVYGDGKNIRDWIYVKDHCRAIWKIMNHSAVGETYNIGGSQEIKNINLVYLICDILDEMLPNKNRRSLITYVQDRLGHDRRYSVDFTKLNKTLGWLPQESFDTGLRKSIVWYLKEYE